MKVSLFVALIILILFVSCGKSYTTTPQITIQSITPIIPVNGNFTASLKFTDKQGDLGGGTFVAIRVRTNTQPFPPMDSVSSLITDTIPEFPNHSSGSIEFTLPAGSFREQVLRNDSCVMKFQVIDRAGNKSDTVTSALIVALYE